MKNNAYKEPYRPQFHFTPEKNWMNDPNGMVYFNGKYHLFYQYHPYGNTWGPMHWGHAVSTDLMHWETLPVALYPDEHGAIFSGSAVVDWNNTTGFFDDSPGLVAIYTNDDTYPDSDRPRQRQSLAYSTDEGMTWIKYEGNPVLSDVEMTDYRDPKVFWHDETNQWMMVLATGQSVTIYTSVDLKKWEFASDFGSKAGAHDGVWECPDLFRLPVDGDEGNQKWVMLVSIGDNPDREEGSRTQYFIGDFDGKSFVNQHSDETVLWLDHGRDNYAGVSWSDIPSDDGRRIYLGWMSNWKYANVVPTEKWKSAMTLPRELSLSTSEEGTRITQRPVKEIELIRKKTESIEPFFIQKNRVKAFAIEALTELTIECEPENATSFDLVFDNSSDEKIVVKYDVEKEILYVDRTLSGEYRFSKSFAAVQKVPIKLKNNAITLQIFIDTSSIEVFVNDGEAAVTSLVFPSGPPIQVQLSSTDGTTNVNVLDITDLNSIWG